MSIYEFEVFEMLDDRVLEPSKTVRSEQCSGNESSNESF